LAPLYNDCFTERQAVMSMTRHIHTYFLREQSKWETQKQN